MGEDIGPIVIVGGGHAAAQLCAALVDADLGASTHLICDEAVLPYQRPPLSKAFLKQPDEALQWHRPAAWFAESGIDVVLADAATSIDLEAREVRLSSGRVLGYGRLVLATGARARRLPHLAEHLRNVAVLRSAADATALRTALATTEHLTVLGGGFIGLEVAASARALGKAVTLIESAPRLLARSLSPELAEHVLTTHRAAGIDVRVGVAAGEFEIDGDRLLALGIDGRRHAVELMLLGIGAAAEHRLASEAGLVCENGIVVDARMRTSDPFVLAIGDCASFPEHISGRRLRLESVQNANDQARTALATLLGRDEPYRALPWFWSEQGSMRLQMAGLAPPEGTRHRRPGANPASFSILHYEGERLASIESVNAPMDHLMAKKLLEAGKSPPPETACDPAVALKSLL